MYKTIKQIFEEAGVHKWFEDELPSYSILGDLPL